MHPGRVGGISQVGVERVQSRMRVGIPGSSISRPGEDGDAHFPCCSSDVRGGGAGRWPRCLSASGLGSSQSRPRWQPWRSCWPRQRGRRGSGDAG